MKITRESVLNMLSCYPTHIDTLMDNFGINPYSHAIQIILDPKRIKLAFIMIRLLYEGKIDRSRHPYVWLK